MLSSLRRRGRRERAIGPDGRRWLDVGHLVSAAEHDAAELPPGGALTVPVDRPEHAVRALLLAQAAGRVPVLAPAAWPVDGPAAILAHADRLDPDDGLLVVLTSGSSGAPRAVVRTEESWHASLPGFDDLLGPQCRPGDTLWAPGTIDSTLTLFGVWHGLATGRPVIASGRWRGSSSVAVGEGATAVHCVPAVLADLLVARREGRLRGLRRAVVAGAALAPELRAAAESAGIAVSEYYGAAELSFVAADRDGRGLRAFPGVELRISAGLVECRSRYLARGYLDGADGPLRRDAAGWAGVGDRGTLDEDGLLRIRGRGEEAAAVGGRVVLLDDVERALAGTPGVAELVCLGEPDPLLGERVLCLVRPEEDLATPDGSPVAQQLGAALRAAARAALPPASRPLRYVVRHEFPRTAGGKVARSALRDRPGGG